MSPLPAHLDHALWRADSLGHNRLPGCASGHALLDAELPDGGWPGGALVELLLPTRAATIPLGGQGELRLLGPALARLARAGGEIALVAPPLQLHAPALAAAGWPLERLLIVDPPTLADAAWATEQALRSRRCAAVVWWTPARAPATAPPARSALAGSALARSTSARLAPDQPPHPHAAATAPARRPSINARPRAPADDRAAATLLRLALRRLHLAAQDTAQDGAGLLFVLRDAACAAQSSPAPLRLLCQPDPSSPLHLQVRLLKRRGPPCTTALRLDTRAAQPPSLGERLTRSDRPAPATLVRPPGPPDGQRPPLALPHALAQPEPAVAAA
ncbi:MAG: hypothetical protein RIQ60_2576 [Pseudomonadota bacterium]|jgi:hypothetical protein